LVEIEEKMIEIVHGTYFTNLTDIADPHIDFDDLSFASLTASHLQFPRLPKSGDSASNTAMSV
jgi:hypothetical protein